MVKWSFAVKYLILNIVVSNWTLPSYYYRISDDPFFVKVAGAYSKTWSYREDALLAVDKKLAEVSSETPKTELKNMMKAAVFLCKRGLTDKVSSVSVRLLVCIFMSGIIYCYNEVNYNSGIIITACKLNRNDCHNTVFMYQE